MKKEIPSLVLSDPDHRHFLAKQYFLKNIKKILDVGGSSKILINGLWKNFIGSPRKVWKVIDVLSSKDVKGLRYTSLNIQGKDYRDDRQPHIFYDGKTMPFPNRCFDLVTAIDTFEHIRLQNRKKVFSEMLRVAKKQIVVVFPFDSLENNKFEDEITRYMKVHNLEIKPSFKQHRAYGLPRINEMEEVIDKTKYAYKIYFGTDRRLFQHYCQLQVRINSLLRHSFVNKTFICKSLKQIESVVTRLLNLELSVPKDKAYRVIIVVNVLK